MAEYTGRFELEIPAPDDYYDIGQYSRNLILLSSALKSMEIGETKCMTAEIYAEISEKNSSTLYIVTTESDFTIYLGDKPLRSSGSVPTSAVFSTLPLTSDAPCIAIIKEEESWQS